MTQYDKTSDNTIIRVSSKFASNSHLLSRLSEETPYSERSNIVKDLIILLSEKEQNSKDMFGYIQVTADEFINSFGYSRKGVLEKAESTYKLNKIDSKDHKEVTNIFEKTLLDVAMHNIPESVKNEDGSYSVIFTPVIAEIKVSEIQRKRNNNPTTYFIKLHNDFKIRHINLFNYISSDLYKHLSKNHSRQTGIHELYLRLEYYKSLLIYKNNGPKEKLINNPISINTIEHICQIKIANLKDKKKKINQKLDIIMSSAKIIDAEKISKNQKSIGLDFEYEWIKDQDKKWHVLITFNFTEAYIEALKEEDRKSKALIDKIFIERLTSLYDEYGTKKFSKENWCKMDKVDFKLKKRIYTELYSEIYPSGKLDSDYLNGRFGY